MNQEECDQPHSENELDRNLFSHAGFAGSFCALHLFCALWAIYCMYIELIQKILPVASDLESHIANNYIIIALGLFSRSYLEHFEKKKTGK